MTLLVVGISARAAAESAVRAGYEVVALDAFGDTDLVSLCPSFSLRSNFAHLDAELGSTTVRLFRASRELEFDEVVFGSGFENHPECVAGWERTGKTVLGNNAEALRSVRDWETLFDYLDSVGIRRPETIIVDDMGGWTPVNLDVDSYIVKPLLSGGGHGIKPLGEILGSPTFPSDWHGRGALIQRCLEGIFASLSFVASPEGFRTLSTTVQIVGSPSSPFRYVGNIAPLTAPPKIRAEMEGTAKAIAEEFHLRGSNGIDFAIAGGEAYVLEVNPRLQGSLEVVEKASGISVFDAHVKACRGEGIPQQGKGSPGFWGRRIVFAPRDIRVGSLARLEFARDIPAPLTPIGEGSPICTVLAHSPSDRSCADLLRAREKKVISLSA